MISDITIAHSYLILGFQKLLCSYQAECLVATAISALAELRAKSQELRAERHSSIFWKELKNKLFS